VARVTSAHGPRASRRRRLLASSGRFGTVSCPRKSRVRRYSANAVDLLNIRMISGVLASGRERSRCWEGNRADRIDFRRPVGRLRRPKKPADLGPLEDPEHRLGTPVVETSACGRRGGGGRVLTAAGKHHRALSRHRSRYAVAGAATLLRAQNRFPRRPVIIECRAPCGDSGRPWQRSHVYSLAGPSCAEGRTRHGRNRRLPEFPARATRSGSGLVTRRLMFGKPRVS